MGFERKLRKIGNSIGVGLPAELIKKYNLKDGDTIYLNEMDGKIILTTDNEKEHEDDFKEKVLAILDEYLKNQESNK